MASSGYGEQQEGCRICNSRSVASRSRILPIHNSHFRSYHSLLVSWCLHSSASWILSEDTVVSTIEVSTLESSTISLSNTLCSWNSKSKRLVTAFFLNTTTFVTSILQHAWISTTWEPWFTRSVAVQYLFPNSELSQQETLHQCNKKFEI